MEKCSICACIVSSERYTLPDHPNKLICPECHGRIAICIANQSNKETEKAWDILIEQTENIQDEEVLEYLASIVMPSETESATNDQAANTKKNKTRNTPNDTMKKNVEKDTPQKQVDIPFTESPIESGVFGNIGVKIKRITKVAFWVETIACVIIGILLIAQDNRYNPTGVIGVVIILLGPFIAWISSLFSYGFGELIDQNKRQNQLLTEILSKTKRK